MPLWKSFFLTLYYHCSRLYRRSYLQKARKGHRVPLIVLFYHRVADYEANSWTTSNKIFHSQISWMESRFKLVSLEEAQRRIRSGVNDQSCVSITFDDGYAENCEQAIPLLIKKQIPCTYFVTVQNVTEEKPFLHDVVQGNSVPPNNLDQLRDMVNAGIEIGAHALTHIDLGQVSDEQQLYEEVVTSREKLQKALGKTVKYFAFPYGHYVNLNPRAFDLANEAGYEAVCSAYGGYNFPGDDAFHLQRVCPENSLIRLKNWVTIDPRKTKTPRFTYDLGQREEA